MTTFVLIHGASQGGWIWQPSAARLRAAGHLVYAPSLDGCGERRHSLRPGITVATQAAEIADLMFYEAGDAFASQLCGAAQHHAAAAGASQHDIVQILVKHQIGYLGTRVTTAAATGPSRENAEGR